MEDGRGCWLAAAIFGLIVISAGGGAWLAVGMPAGTAVQLRVIDWNAIGAIATTCATILALVTSVAAIRAPAWQRAEERSESTHEVLMAAAAAVELFGQAKSVKGAIVARALADLSPRANMQRMALERLIERPIITDGAIITGVGAIQLMQGVFDQLAEYHMPSPPGGFARRIPNHLEALEEVEKLVLVRAQQVARYAIRKRWPGWERRFAAVAEKGLAAVSP